jgi:hypothetical protein
MFLPSKLWPSRTNEHKGDGQIEKAGSGMFSRLLGRGDRPSPPAKAGPREALFDSFAAKADRNLGESDLHGEHPSTSMDSPTRQMERLTPLQPNTTLLDSKGKRHRGRIINFSATGVAVEADFAALNPDAVTHVGSMRVRAGRAMHHGMVFIFDKPLDPSRCKPSTVL